MPPTFDVLDGVQAVAAGDAHTCVLLATAAIRCLGDHGHGQLGVGGSAKPSAVIMCE